MKNLKFIPSLRERVPELKPVERFYPRSKPDIICLSHLRWDFVFQRPHHLMTRLAKNRRVFFVEEPMRDGEWPRMDFRPNEDVSILKIVPHLPEFMTDEETHRAQRLLMDELLRSYKIQSYYLWYYTPLAVLYTSHLDPDLVVYDCMDELSTFKGAHPLMRAYEAELFRRADVVFTGGYSLYEAKKSSHHNIHPFPSSIDVEHFKQARKKCEEPDDQSVIRHPRFGYFGVLDERIDLDLIDRIAEREPTWNFIFIGPVTKIDFSSLPRRPNIYYLGKKEYSELPRYLAGWDVALMPFAMNGATQFISPTKTPEYLAAGRPVVSTPIRDVVRSYGDKGFVHIASSPEEFVKACKQALVHTRKDGYWLERVDRLLAQTSWDRCAAEMCAIIETTRDVFDDQSVRKRQRLATYKEQSNSILA